MRRAAAVATFVLAAGAVSPAFAKPPKSADETTVEDICQQARAALERIKQAEQEKAHDARRELIDNFRDKKVTYDQWKPVADILMDVKDPSAANYRGDAATALGWRFTHEEDKDPVVRATRRQVMLYVLELMKADAKKDEIGLKAVESLMLQWYRPNVLGRDLAFHAGDKLPDRIKAYGKWKKWLESQKD
jgi:hypothetical protein